MGFLGVMRTWRETAANMMDIGSQLAEHLSTELGNAFSSFLLGAKSAGEAFAEFGKRMLEIVVNLMAQKTVQILLGGIFGGPGLLFSGFKGTAGGLVTKASGGLIVGGSGTKDDVPAVLTSGEYVLNRRAVNRIGVGNLDWLNYGVRSYAEGGVVAPVVSSQAGAVYNINVNVSSTGADLGSSMSGSIDANEMARAVKNAVLAVVMNQQRQGGILRR
jgi:lambda family phage tail tape measure protein